MPISRRSFLFLSLANAGLLSLGRVQPAIASQVLVPNVTGLYTVAVAGAIQPVEVKEIVSAMRSWDGKVCVGGGRYSMGGQVAVSGGLHIDMRSMNKLVWFRPEERRVRVQAGMRWRDLQDVIDPHGLAVRTGSIAGWRGETDPPVGRDCQVAKLRGKPLDATQLEPRTRWGGGARANQGQSRSRREVVE